MEHDHDFDITIKFRGRQFSDKLKLIKRSVFRVSLPQNSNEGNLVTKHAESCAFR